MAYEMNLAAREIGRKLGKSTLDEHGWTNSLCPCHQDENPSFSIKDPEKAGNRPPVACHRGCRKEDIWAELERRGWITKVASEKKDNVYNFKSLEASYEYQYEDGSFAYESLKYRKKDGKKDFSQRHKDAKGEWVYSLKGIRRVLFHLPQLLEACKNEQIVFILEGEKDVLTAEAMGLVATTNPLGAKKWKEEFNYTDSLKGASAIFIIPDNDETGRDHANQVAASCKRAGFQVHVVHLSGVPEKGDLTDWVELGGTYDSLLDLAALAPEWQPLKDDDQEYEPSGIGEEGDDVDLSVEPLTLDDDEELDSDDDDKEPAPGQYSKAIKLLGLGDFPDGDLANGERLVKRHGEHLRFTEVGWVAWNGTYWDIGSRCPKASELAKEVIKVGIKEEIALVRKLSPALAKRLRQWQKKCATSANAVSQMLKMASTDPKITASLLSFDADPWLLNCRNGTLELEGLVLQPHKPENLCSRRIEVDYDPTAEAPIFQQTLLRSCKGNIKLMNFLMRIFGLNLPGVILEQKLYMLLGPGGSGKSLISNRIFKLMGPYAKNVRKQMFMFRNGTESHTDNLGQLRGMRMVVVSEISPRDTFDESVLKDLSGDDPVTGRYLFGEPFDFVPQCKIFFRSNHKPKVDGTDTGVKRRLIIIPFTEKVDEAEQDNTIKDKIDKHEQSGLLNMCLAGLEDYRNNGGLRVPPEVVSETTEYHEENDTFGTFLKDSCVLNLPAAEVPAKLLRQTYTKYCEENGYFPMNQTNFGKEMKRRGFGKRETNGRFWYQGIGLRAEAYID